MDFEGKKKRLISVGCHTSLLAALSNDIPDKYLHVLFKTEPCLPWQGNFDK